MHKEKENVEEKSYKVKPEIIKIIDTPDKEMELN